MSLDKISLTLYDLIGYLLPGYIVVAAFSIIEANFSQTNVFHLSRISQDAFTFAVLAYILGSAAHALGSWAVKKWPSNRRDPLAPEIERSAKKVAQSIFDIPYNSITSNELYLLADSYIVANGGSVERDIITAREGFFKAAMASLSILSIALVASLLSEARVQISSKVYIEIDRIGLVFIIVLVLLLAYIFRSRYTFFNCIKRNNAIRLFLAIRQKNMSKPT